MICSSEKRFFTSDLLSSWDRTLKLCATQIGGDVACTAEIKGREGVG
jgi:hypothetical protein